MNENRAVFEELPVPKALASLAAPTIISQLITMIYNLADTFFIGRTNNPYQVAAASLSFVLFFFLNGLANLFGVGGGSLISRLMGRGQDGEARRVCAFSLYGALLASGLYALVCGVWMEPILWALGASEETFQYAAQYAKWVIVVGAVPATLSMTMAHLLRSEGYARHAGFGLGMGGVLNIVLDPLFMFVILPPGMEVAGAAFATMLSNGCALLYFCVVYFCLRRRALISASPRAAWMPWTLVRSLLAVGLPAALTSFFGCVANMSINRLAADYSDHAVAAMGIVKKIDMLPMNVGIGLCQGMMPLVAYNYSAKNYQRMHEAVRCTRIAGFSFAAACVLAFELLAPQAVRLFIDDAETVRLGAVFLRIACTAVPFTILNIQASHIFQAIGRGPQSLLLASCRQGLINLPMQFLLNATVGVYGLISAQPVADVLTAVASLILYSRLARQLAREGAARCA